VLVAVVVVELDPLLQGPPVRVLVAAAATTNLSQ
jgi:hypothetical protein